MALNYYQNLFENGYKQPSTNTALPQKKPRQTLPANPGVVNIGLQQPSTLTKPLQNQAPLTQAGQGYQNAVTGMVNGNLPGVTAARTQDTRLNAQDSSSALKLAKEQAARAGYRPGTAAYDRMLKEASAQSNSNALARTQATNQFQRQSYLDALGLARDVETDAYGRAAAERAYGTERDDVLYGRQLNERDYATARGDKALDEAKSERDWQTNQDRLDYTDELNATRLSRQDFETDRAFDANMFQNERLADQFDRQFGEDTRRFDLTRSDNRADRATDDAFRTSQATEDTRRFDLNRGDQLGRYQVADDQFDRQFGEDSRRYDLNRSDTLAQNERLADQFDRQFGEDTRRYDLNRGDTLSQNQLLAEQWDKEFGANRSDRAADEAYRVSQDAEDARRYDLSRSDNRADRAADDAFRTSQAAEDTRRYDLTRSDDRSDKEQEYLQWNTNREDVLAQEAIKNNQLDRQFNADEDYRKGLATEDSRRYNLDRLDQLTQNQRLADQFDKEFELKSGAQKQQVSETKYNQYLSALGSNAAKTEFSKLVAQGYSPEDAYGKMFNGSDLKYQDISSTDADLESRAQLIQALNPGMTKEQAKLQAITDAKGEYDFTMKSVRDQMAATSAETKLNQGGVLTDDEVDALIDSGKVSSVTSLKGIGVDGNFEYKGTVYKNEDVGNGLSKITSGSNTYYINRSTGKAYKSDPSGLGKIAKMSLEVEL